MTNIGEFFEELYCTICDTQQDVDIIFEFEKQVYSWYLDYDTPWARFAKKYDIDESYDAMYFWAQEIDANIRLNRRPDVTL